VSTNGSVSPKRGPGEVSVHGGLPDREVEARGDQPLGEPTDCPAVTPSRDPSKGVLSVDRPQHKKTVSHRMASLWLILGGLLLWRDATSRVREMHHCANRRTDSCRQPAYNALDLAAMMSVRSA
jgi:hypothetical protein